MIKSVFERFFKSYQGRLSYEHKQGAGPQFMKVYGLRVMSASGTCAGVFGTTEAGVVAQDDRVYATFPAKEYRIERKRAETDDFADAPGAPTRSDDPQEWAEFIWTPGGDS